MTAAPGGGAPGRYGVIGQPIRHSLSPALFRWLFTRLGLPHSYEAVEIAPDALGAVVEEVRQGRWSGLSVTLPHKEAVRRYLDGEDPLARRIGAVNTLVPGPQGVRGYNTDAHGLVRALGRGGTAIAGARALVLGAGGAARAAVFALLQEGAAHVSIANRTAARAETLATEATAAVGPGRCEAIALDVPAIAAAVSAAQLLVQATQVGMGDAAGSPLPGAGLHPGLTVLDMVYRPLETAFLREARARGARAVDGLWMLVYQALEQLRLWTGHQAPDEVAVALHEHLSGEAT